VIGLGPIAFPEYLARADIVTRSADNRIEISPNDRWAEPLDVTFRRVLAQDLSTALGGAQVAVFPWFGAPVKFSRRVEIQVDRFDEDADNTAHLVASWTITDGSSGRIVYASSSDISVPAATAARSDTGAPGASDRAAMAAALSGATDRFATEIASAIQRLPA
jgi:uncharacterized lipoprotein YmbA